MIKNRIPAGRFFSSTKLSVFSVALALLGTISCRPSIEPLSPEGMERVPLETVQGWLEGMAPTRSTRIDVNWTFQSQQGWVRGQAALRVMPPDSMRFDYRGPFGRSGASVMVENEVVWAEPEEEVELLLPAVPLFWAALGMPRDPDPGVHIIGLETNEERRWRYGVNGDTLDYVVSRIPPHKLQASMRSLGDVIGFVEVDYDETQQPIHAMITFPQTATRFTFDVTKVDTTVSFSENVWKRP